MNHARRLPSARIIVGTPANFDSLLPFRLSSRAVLRAATEAEVTRIKTYLHELSPIFNASQLFECNFKTDYKHNIDAAIRTVEHIATPLPPSSWRYHVVTVSAYRGNLHLEDQPDLRQLRLSSQLSVRPLFLNTALVQHWRHTLDYGADWHHFTNPTDDQYSAMNFSAADLHDWKQTDALVARVRTDFPSIWHSLQLFSQLPIKKGHNELTVLALFAVIESLLTHNPRGDFDSIGHQIRTKMLLVENRMDVRLDYSYFGEGRPATIWKKLYELRSRIAHGSPVTFAGPPSSSTLSSCSAVAQLGQKLCWWFIA